MPATRSADGIRLAVRLTPRASANRVQGVVARADGSRALRCQVVAIPEAGKANAALLKLLAKTLRCPKTSLNIVSGAADRNKVVAVSGDPVALEGALSDAIAGADNSD